MDELITRAVPGVGKVVRDWVPEDQGERDRILDDLDTSLLVEAGAGSGKTTIMVGRMVRLIRAGREVDRIAAVTFTRKAASELKERFQIRLEEAYQALAARPPEGLDAREAAELERLERALAGVDRCFVGTVHSFCGRLLRERPLEARVPPGFVETSGPDEERLRTECWGRFLEHLATRHPRSRLLSRLAGVGLKPAQLRRAFEEVSANPDIHWDAPRAAPPAPDALRSVRRALEALLDESRERMPAEEPAGGWCPLQSKIRSLHFSRRILGWDDRLRFLDALQAAVERKHDPKVTFWGVPRPYQEVKELAARWDRFAEPDGAAARLLEAWRAYRYPIAIRFARAAAAFYARERLRSGRLGFQDLLLLSARLLRGDAAVRRELGERYQHLLIDEFQDTDPIQAEVVFLLADDGSSGGDWLRARPRPGALFVVGDPKQSIYRFRRADISVYNQVKHRFQEWGAVLGLTANFRSGTAVERLVNRVFDAPGFFPPEETEHQARFAPLRVRPGAGEPEGVFFYSVHPGGSTASQAAVAAVDAPLLAGWIDRRIREEGRAPRDFLVLTKTTHHLHRYARALEGYGIPVRVSGARVGMEEELRALVLLLRALADPGDAAQTLAVLEGLFFGLSHEQLYAHVHAGGGIGLARRAQPEGPVADALARLAEFAEWVRTAPADVAVARIVERLGLLPFAAAGELGATRAGALVYALDALRVAGLDGQTSIREAIEVLDAALAAEADAPLMPGEADAVRVMNLHKAKGLEAPIVVLAHPFGEKDHAIRRHVARRPDGTAAGYLQLFDSTRRNHPPLVALPPAWAGYEEAERPFGAAEEVRQLYVAATRAGRELVVARCALSEETSPWAGLHPALEDGEVAREVALSVRQPPPREALAESPEEIGERTAALARRRGALRRASYHAAPVTARVKGGRAPTHPERGGAGDRSGRGAEWGTAVHRALEAAGKGATGEALRAACRDFLREAGRPVDPRGEPRELDELAELVERVCASEVWRRARGAEHLLVEAPFALTLPTATLCAWEGREAAEDEPPLQGVEGVIDLVFREPSGWVIADYKTDVFPDPEVRRERLALYRRQVDLYAACWEHVTGEPVRERILVLTSEGGTERW